MCFGLSCAFVLDYQSKAYGPNIRRVFCVLAAFCVFRLVEAIVDTDGDLTGQELWIRVGLVVLVLLETIITMVVVRATALISYCSTAMVIQGLTSHDA